MAGPGRGDVVITAVRARGDRVRAAAPTLAKAATPTMEAISAPVSRQNVTPAPLARATISLDKEKPFNARHLREVSQPGPDIARAARGAVTLQLTIAYETTSILAVLLSA